MHKKIGSGVVCVIFSTVCVFGMEQEHALREAVRKGIISDLSVNDYIINVPNAYRGLFKGMFFEHNMLRIKAQEMNKRCKERVKNGCYLAYRLPDKKTLKRLTPMKIPYFRYVDFDYKTIVEDGLEFECVHTMNAHIRIATWCYFPLHRKPYIYSRTATVIKNISAPIQNNIIRLFPTNKPVFIELYAQDQISDWIKITHSYHTTSDTSFNFDLGGSLFHPRDMSPIECPFSCRMTFCSLMFGITVTLFFLGIM